MERIYVDAIGMGAAFASSFCAYALTRLIAMNRPKGRTAWIVSAIGATLVLGSTLTVIRFAIDALERQA